MEKGSQHRFDLLKLHLSRLSMELAHLDQKRQDAASISDIRKETALMTREHQVLVEIHEIMVLLAEIIAQGPQGGAFLPSELPLFSALGAKKT